MFGIFNKILCYINFIQLGHAISVFGFLEFDVIINYHDVFRFTSLVDMTSFMWQHDVLFPIFYC